MKGASQHQADVEKDGDEAMGFPHERPRIISGSTLTAGRLK
jgi:hypothetical protein